MNDMYILVAVTALVGIAIVAVIIPGILHGQGRRSSTRLPLTNPAELWRYEYETMLRHRRRERNKKEFEEQKLVEHQTD